MDSGGDGKFGANPIMTESPDEKEVVVTLEQEFREEIRNARERSGTVGFVEPETRRDPSLAVALSSVVAALGFIGLFVA